MVEIDANKKSDLEAIWNEAAVPLSDTTGAPIEQALIGRLNLRIDVMKALKAALKTAKVAAEFEVAKVTAAPPPTWLGIALDAYGAIQAIFGAMVQTMRPLDYVACVILANEDKPISVDELESAVRNYLNDPASRDFAWYLGMTDAFAGQAREMLNAKKAFERVVEMLRKEQFIKGTDSEITFVPRHFTFGITKV